MRKIIVLSMITLDGVMQSPGGLKEDPTGKFKHGGWAASIGADESFSKALQKELKPADYLLGRRTFEAWAGFWPLHGDFWPGINKGKKYVFSKTLTNKDPVVAGWKNSYVIKTVADIKKLKASQGRNIQVWGSGELIQLLLKNDLVDELVLKIFPITLGNGKKLFDDGTTPSAYKLVSSTTTSKGVIIAHYKRGGKIKTGTIKS